MPCTPVGSPNRNSDRMIVMSGRRLMPRSKWITEPGRVRHHKPYSDTSELLAIVPMAAPTVPIRGISTTLKAMVRNVIHRPRRQRPSGISGGAKRAAQHEEHHHAGDADEHRAQERQRLGRNLGGGVHQAQQRRRRHVADRRQDAADEERGQKRLVDDAIHLLGLVRAGKARHQHAHAGEERAGEHHHHQDDLPADADGGVRGVADELAHHGVIDDALQAGDDVLQHRRPCQPPHRWRDGAFHDRTIEGFLLLGCTCGHELRSVLRGRQTSSSSLTARCIGPSRCTFGRSPGER